MDRYVDRSTLCVLGAGAFAAAVRSRLRVLAHTGGRTSLFEHAASDDMTSLSFEPALFVACSDFENSTLWPSLADRVRADHCSILFSCLTQFGVRVGPLVASGALANFPSRYLTQSWDFSLYDTRETSAPNCSMLTSIADRRTTRVAQNGATVLIGELAKVMRRRRENRPGEGVAENDSASEEGDGMVADVVTGGNGTIVASGYGRGGLVTSSVGAAARLARWGERRAGCGWRVWHPGGID